MRVIKQAPLCNQKILNAVDSMLYELRGDNVIINSLQFNTGLYIWGNEFDVPDSVHVFGFGKASGEMARGLGTVLHDRIAGGSVLTGHNVRVPGVNVAVTAHPVPDAYTVEQSRRIVRYVNSLDEHAFVVFLISGGASSLFEVPRIPLERYARILRALILRGANIHEINRVRIFLSSVKGGKLLGHFRGRCISLILSDVIGAPSLVGSGPTYATYVEREEVMRILKKYGVNEDIPAADPAPRRGCENIVLADNMLARTLLSSRLSATLVEEPMVGDVQDVAERILSYTAPGTYVFGGEPTVNVGAAQGMGGRNQELAFLVAEAIAGTNDLFVSLGTDGIDGPTDAAGALVDGTTAGQLARRQINMQRVLSEHDTYHALKSINALIYTGSTGTNVADVMVLVRKSGKHQKNLNRTVY